MFNMMQQNMMGGMNPFTSPMGGGMPQPMSAAPQIPVRQAPAAGAQAPIMPQTPASQGQQQQGFFGNMMSSPQQMKSGIDLGKGAYNGISGMFGGDNPAINPAGAPFSATMAGPPMPALDMGANAAANTGMFSAMSAAPTAAIAAAPAAAGMAGAAGAAGAGAAASGLPTWLSSLLFL